VSLKTRLDSRSIANDRFEIKDEEGNMIAEVVLAGPASANLEISTAAGLHIAKPSGWISLK
tara:strand:- start:3652 stop:3834 length:183 start_codon:yes stop_codon:yes gene_type:complete